jgi:hypothetical protein
MTVAAHPAALLLMTTTVAPPPPVRGSRAVAEQQATAAARLVATPVLISIVFNTLLSEEIRNRRVNSFGKNTLTLLLLFESFANFPHLRSLDPFPAFL